MKEALLLDNSWLAFASKMLLFAIGRLAFMAGSAFTDIQYFTSSL